MAEHLSKSLIFKNSSICHPHERDIYFLKIILIYCCSCSFIYWKECWINLYHTTIIHVCCTEAPTTKNEKNSFISFTIKNIYNISLPHSLVCLFIFIFLDQRLMIRDLINILNTSRIFFYHILTMFFLILNSLNNLWTLVVIFIHNFRDF